MSASEKLKALEHTLYRPLPHPHEGERQLMAALPQIVAVVEAAEDGLIEHSAIYDREDPHCGECGKYAYGQHSAGCHSAAAFAALAALEEALS